MLGGRWFGALTAGCLLVVVPPGAAPYANAGASTPAEADPGAPLQWGLEAIGARSAWTVARGEGIVIAIVDSGIDLGHEDLAANVTGSVSCLDTGGDPTACTGFGEDDDGHGTHVAGIAAAVADNGIGIVGVAPAASLLAVKALAHSCGLTGCGASGNASDVSAAIRWATDHGADIVNLSLGSTTQAVLGPSFDDAIRYAWDQGVIPVVAAGNDYILSPGFSTEPALVVSAVDRDGTKASYSNGVGSAQWALAAPGGEAGDDESTCATGSTPLGVLSTYLDAGGGHAAYACLAGTSMAAPHVAGAAAVLRSAGLTPQETVDRLLGTADDLGSPGRDSTFGAGRVNLARAVEGLGLAATTSIAATSSPAPASMPPPPAGTTTVPIPPGVGGQPAANADPSFGSAVAPIDLGGAEVAATAGSGNSPNGDEPPTGWVAAAVLLVVIAAGATAWVRFRGAAWARRTPPTPPPPTPPGG